MEDYKFNELYDDLEVVLLESWPKELVEDGEWLYKHFQDEKYLVHILIRISYF